MKRPQAYSKRVGAGGGWLKLLLLLLALILSCRKSITPPPPQQQYDPRNISRTEGNSYQPTIGVDSRGRVFVAWMEADGLFFKWRDEEGNWSEIDTLTDDCWGPELVIDPWDNVHIVWETSRHGRNVFYMIRTPDGEWSDVENISWPLTGWNEQPRIAVDSNGVVHVVWINYSIYHVYKEPGGEWSSPEVAASYGINPSQLVCDVEGGALVKNFV